MFKNGFISSDMYDAIKTSYWNSERSLIMNLLNGCNMKKFNLHKRRYRDDDFVKRN